MSKVFPMLDGPSIPWSLAQIIHQAHNASFGDGAGSRSLQGVMNTGGYRWADVPRAFEVLKRRDRNLYRKLSDQARELAMVVADMHIPKAEVPLSALTPAEIPAGGLGDLVVVCWKWKSAQYRVRYESSHVNILAAMVKRNYRNAYRFVCITDDATGLDKHIEVLPLWGEHARVANPSGIHLPSCFRRLKLFSSEMGDILKARRVVSLDLDVVITGDITPLWDRPELFVGWRVPSTARTRYAFNGSMWMTVPGAYGDIWNKFDPVKSPALAKAAQYFGSDQGWMSYYLRDLDLPGWTAVDGVYSYPREVRTFGRLPHNARIVIFHGGRKPWESTAFRGHPWISQHYRK